MDTHRLLKVGNAISSIVDFEQSSIRGRTSVKPGVDVRLDQLKRQYDGMDDFLKGVIENIRNQLPKSVAQHIKSCMFLPQLGFLTLVEYGAGAKSSQGITGDFMVPRRPRTVLAISSHPEI